MTIHPLSEFKAEVDSVYKIVLCDLSSRLDKEVSNRGNKFWKRVNGYGLYRMCYIFVNEYNGAPVLLKSNSYFTFDHIRSEYEFCKEIDSSTRFDFNGFLLEIIQKFLFKVTQPKFLFWRTYIPLKTILRYAFGYRFKFIPFKLKLKNSGIQYQKNEILRNIIFNKSFGKSLSNEQKQEQLRLFFIKYYPILVLEAFENAENEVLRCYNFLEPTNAIINESFTSDHEASFILGVLNHKYDIQHWYNEHNKLTHIFKFNTNDIISGLVDRVYTNGWAPRVSGKYVQSQSLYLPFKAIKKPRKKNLNDRILYICGATFEEITEFANSSIESSGMFKKSFLKRRNEIFNFFIENKQHGLDIKTHPLFKAEEQNVELQTSYNVNYIGAKISLNNIIQNYRLVIVEYVSTTYVECLLNNIPVVCICDRKTYQASAENDIVDELFSVNIFTDEIDQVIAKVVLNVNQVDNWWHSSKTEQVRKKFIASTVRYGPDLFTKLNH